MTGTEEGTLKSPAFPIIIEYVVVNLMEKWREELIRNLRNFVIWLYLLFK